MNNEIDDLIKKEIPTKEELGLAGKSWDEPLDLSKHSQEEKEVEKKVVEVVEDCKVYRGVFILKTELIRKLEEAFPEK